MEPSTLQFFYDLGIPVANGYGLTEAGTVLTVNDLKPFRADTVGKPLPGVELRILNPDAEGIGEVAAHSKTVMSHYLDDPELTAQTIVDGWLLTGDLGRFDGDGHLQLFGRKKNMIVTEGGKNIYPEDIENAFDGLPVKEYCIFAANYLWPAKTLGREMLVLLLRLEQNQEFTEALKDEIIARNRRLPDFKRVGGYLAVRQGFSPNRIHENQAHRAGRGSPQNSRPRCRGRTVSAAGTFLAVVNPAAGGGRCRKLVPDALDRLRAGGIKLDVVETTGPGQGTNLARDALFARVIASSSRWAAMARRMRSSMDFFRGESLTNLPRWHFFLWEPAIHSCANSPIAEWNTPSRRCSRGDRNLVTFCDCVTRMEFSITSICWPWGLRRMLRPCGRGVSAAGENWAINRPSSFRWLVSAAGLSLCKSMERRDRPPSMLVPDFQQQ